MEVQRMICCAMTEISGIREFTPESAITAMLEYDPSMRYSSIVLFTGAAITKELAPYAERFRDYIEDNKLGKVTRKGPLLNRNTNRYVSMYTWTTDKDALTLWAAKKHIFLGRTPAYDPPRT